MPFASRRLTAPALGSLAMTIRRAAKAEATLRRLLAIETCEHAGRNAQEIKKHEPEIAEATQ